MKFNKLRGPGSPEGSGGLLPDGGEDGSVGLVVHQSTAEVEKVESGVCTANYGDGGGKDGRYPKSGGYPRVGSTKSSLRGATIP